MSIDEVVHELIEQVRENRALTRDVPALQQVLARYPDYAAASIAQRAHAIWKESVSRGDMDRAQGSALLANIVFSAAGDEASSLRAAYDYSQTRFMLANDVGAYESLRQQMAGLYARATQIGIDDLAFSAATSLADCTYFATTCEPDRGRRDAILFVLSGDLLVACDALRACKSRPAVSSLDFGRFVSLAASAYGVLRERLNEFPPPYFLDEAGAKAQEYAERMNQLAAATEELVPVDFAFGPGEDPAKSTSVAAALADLSMTNGNEASARARLRASLRHG